MLVRLLQRSVKHSRFLNKSSRERLISASSTGGGQELKTTGQFKCPKRYGMVWYGILTAQLYHGMVWDITIECHPIAAYCGILVSSSHEAGYLRHCVMVWDVYGIS